MPRNFKRSMFDEDYKWIKQQVDLGVKTTTIHQKLGYGKYAALRSYILLKVQSELDKQNQKQRKQRMKMNEIDQNFDYSKDHLRIKNLVLIGVPTSKISAYLNYGTTSTLSAYIRKHIEQKT